MYIRKKTVKGISYAYLVESKWDKEKKQSNQVLLKYLGRFENLKLDKLTHEELSVVSKYMDEVNVKEFPMDSHISKYKIHKNKHETRIDKHQINEQKKIERTQKKMLKDLNMEKHQFHHKFGWKNTISKSIEQIPVNQ